MKNILFIFIFFVVSFPSFAQQDTLRLKTGETIVGQILDDDNGVVVFRTKGKTKTFYKDDIECFKSSQAEKVNTNKKEPEKTDKTSEPKPLNMGMALGYSTQNIMSFQLYFAGKSGWGFDINAGFNIVGGTKGEKMNTVSWSEFPEDFVKKGSYYNTFNVGLVYYFPKMYLSGLVGVAQCVEYQNRYDDLHILGDNGNYFITRNNGVKFNYGAEFGFLLNGFLIGFNYCLYDGAGLKLGLYF